MKKLIFALLFITTIVQAENSQWEKLIIEKMLTSLSHQPKVNVYTDDTKLKAKLALENHIHFTQSCVDADFILSTLSDKPKCNKPKIVFNYREYLHSPKAIAVFFWQKGRPTIRFSSKRLHQFGLNVTGELSKFVSSK